MRFDASDIQGLMPSVDPRRTDKIFVLSGENYILDVKGPKSAFGNRFVTPFPLGRPQHTQGVRLKLTTGDRVFTFTGDSILEWSENLGTWRVIYVIGDAFHAAERWTSGYLNGIMYFCHPVTGILAYNVNQDVCLPLESEGLPALPIAIRINNGRLIVMDEKFIYWSAPGDGTNFTPSLGGAGFQLIADRVSGSPIMITVWAKGILCWTTGGVLQGQFSGGAAVYTWRAINTEYQPVNSFCTVQMDDNTMVILDERGLFKSSGDAPEPLTPLFNEFLIQYLQDNDLRLGQNVRLEWDELKRLLYLSISLSQYDPVYEKAFVLYPSIDKWGTFDEKHFGILPWLIQDSSRAGNYFGFVDSDGRCRYWGGQLTREIYPTGEALNGFQATNQKPLHYSSGDKSSIVVSSSGRVDAIPIGEKTRDGFYGPDLLAAQPSKPSITNLRAWIQIGFLRLLDQNRMDHLVECIAYFVGSLPALPAPGESEDYNTSTNPDQDYNILVGSEDFGFGGMNFTNHGLKIIGTVDGKTEFDSVEPELERFDEEGRFYSGCVTGLWHKIEISARETGQSFHIRVVELTAVDGGSLN